MSVQKKVVLVTGDLQAILSSPLAGRNRTGYSYIATLKQTLWSDAALISYAEDGTSDTLDHLLGDRLGMNGLALPANLYLSRLFLLQNLAARHIQFVAGRVVLSDFFDTNRVANCETTEFLAGSLINNPTISFPEAGTGIAARLAPVSWFHVLAGAGDAAAGATEPDFATAFRPRDNAFGMLQFGLSPFSGQHAGTYRFLLWHNPPAGWSGGGEPRDNHGFGASFDQTVSDHLTLFLRCGWADAPVGGLTNFVSAGARLKTPFPGRDQDALFGGMAWGRTEVRDETLVELDCHLHVTGGLSLTPLVQVIVDPAQNRHDDAFVLAGLRAVYVF
jgi:carbohydrate-selective porin OprB